MKIRKIIGLLLVITLILANVSGVYAKEKDSDNEPSMSEKKCENDEIQKGVIVLDDLTQVYYEISELANIEAINNSDSINSLSSTVYGAVKSVSGYFYIVSSGVKVAEYGLYAAFYYDNSMVAANTDSCYSWSSSLQSGWSIRDNHSSGNNSMFEAYCAGSYSLEKDGEYNNFTMIRIKCNEHGVITVY